VEHDEKSGEGSDEVPALLQLKVRELGGEADGHKGLASRLYHVFSWSLSFRHCARCQLLPASRFGEVRLG